ncbi:MAG: two-component system response regulator HydG [Myxococcota bacterium]|jgi:two-component system response regulator HydG
MEVAMAHIHRILVVEDDHSLARLIELWLGRAGYAVEVLHDGLDAIQRIHQGRYDAIVSDVHLPHADGIEVLAASRAEYPRVPALLMTAGAGVEYASAAIDMGVDAYVMKPLLQGDLVKRIRNALAKVSPATGRTILAIGAHPDDVEIAIGGTLAAHRDAGDEIILLCLSWGASGGGQRQRRAEAEAAAHVLGATLYGGDLRDTRFDLQTTIAAIERVVHEVHPDVVYTHCAEDVHQDHRSTHDASLVACRNVSTLFAYQSPSTTVAFQPTRFQDISDQIDDKMALIACHESQASCRRYMAPELLRSTARYWGRFSAGIYVEPLVVIREAAIGLARAS